jgi:hypothetical protein
VDFLAEVLLPLCDVAFELPDLPHEVLESGVHLDFEGVVCHPFHTLLDEGEYPDLLVLVQDAVPVQIEDRHELLQRSNLGQVVQVTLEMLKDDFDHFFGELEPCDIVLLERLPNGRTLRRCTLVHLHFLLNLADHCGVDRGQRVQVAGLHHRVD